MDLEPSWERLYERRRLGRVVADPDPESGEHKPLLSAPSQQIGGSAASRDSRPFNPIAQSISSLKSETSKIPEGGRTTPGFRSRPPETFLGRRDFGGGAESIGSSIGGRRGCSSDITEARKPSSTHYKEEIPKEPLLSRLTSFLTSAPPSKPAVSGTGTSSSSSSDQRLPSNPPTSTVRSSTPNSGGDATGNLDKQQQQEGFVRWFLSSLGEFILYGPSKPVKGEEPKKVEWKWWHAWDISKNSREIFIRDRDTDMNVLDGIRALAFMWVLNDHLEEALEYYMSNFGEWISSVGGITQAISGQQGDQGVTTFFVLSGFLIPFILIRLVKSKKERYMSFWTAVEFLFRRYVRIAPSIAASTIFAIGYGYYSDNSRVHSTFYTACQKNWWQNFVFLSNYSGMLGLENCYDSTWTISVEMQLYVLTVPVIYMYCWEREYGFYAALVWSLVSFGLRTLCVFYVDAGVLSYGDYVYTASFSRADEYGIGMLLYMIWEHHVYEKKKRAEEEKESKEDPFWKAAKQVSFWTCLFGVIALGFYYIAADDEWFTSTGGSYNQYKSFAYTLFALTVAAVAYLGLEGTLWPINYVLSSYIFFPIASLAYTSGVINIMNSFMYGGWICGATGVEAGDFVWEGTAWDYLFLYFQVLFLNLACGLILSLLVERPFMNLGKRVKF